MDHFKSSNVRAALLIGLFLLGQQFFSSWPAYAISNCESVDFSGRLGPARNQLDKSWCFAESAADLIGDHLKLTPREQVSALDIASNYYLTDISQLRAKVDVITKTKSAPEAEAGTYLQIIADQISAEQKVHFGQNFGDRRGGFVQQAIGAANFKGICREAQLPMSMASGISSENNEGFHAIARAEGRESRNVECQPAIDFKVCSLGSKCFTDFANKVNELAVRKSLEVIDAQCSPRKPFSQLLVAQTTGRDEDEGSKQLQTALDDSLTRSRPASLAYSHCFLLEKTDGLDPQTCAHASTIVGRRRNPLSGKCQYKIRDSFGESCVQYKSSYRKNCERGQVWVNSQELLEHSQDVTTILPDSEIRRPHR